MRESTFSWGGARDGDTAGHDVGGRSLARRTYGAAMAPGAMVTTGNDMMRFVAAFAESKLPALLGLPDGIWEQFVAPDHPGYGMGVVVGRADGHLLVGHSGTTMGYNAGFTAMPLERAGWFVLENGNGGPYLKAEIDRAFVSWRTGTSEPRHRVMQVLRAVVAFFGALLSGLGILQLGFFVASCSIDRPTLIWPRRVGGLRVAARLLTAAGLTALVVAWFVFFHTDAFYPAFTTAWLPYPFRFVTLGVALFALRGALACVFVGCRAAAPQASRR